MGEFSLSHWLIIAVIVLLFVGPSKLPGLGKGMGEAIRGFKKGLNDDTPDGDDPNKRITPGVNTDATMNAKDTTKAKTNSSDT